MIMGANLGTTTTFWIVSYLGFKFSLSKIALPCIGIGVVMYYIRQNAKIRNMGETLIGFGLLFLGLSLLKDAVPDVKSNPEILEFIKDYTDFGFGSIILFFIGGILLTIIVQSSSVAGAITLTLAYKGWFGFDIAAAIILGENIGTTVTANIAALGTNTEARRAAFAHFIFNVIGVLWILPVFGLFLAGVDALMPGDALDETALPMHMAAFHTLFNLANILLLIGFVPLIAKIVRYVIKDSSNEETEFRYLSSSAMPRIGEMNLMEAEDGMAKLSNLGLEMFTGFKELLKNPDEDLSEKVRKIKQMEEYSDKLTFDITKFLTMCTSQNLSQSHATKVTNMFLVVSELEDICDNCYRIVKVLQRKFRNKISFEKETLDEMLALANQVEDFMVFTKKHINKPVTAEIMESAMIHKKSIRQRLKALRQDLTEKMHSTGNIDPGMLALDTLTHLKYISNEHLNILQAQAHSDDVR